LPDPFTGQRVKCCPVVQYLHVCSRRAEVQLRPPPPWSAVAPAREACCLKIAAAAAGVCTCLGDFAAAAAAAATVAVIGVWYVKVFVRK